MDRPRVSFIMAASADGKVTTADRVKLRFRSEQDRRFLEELRLDADAVLLGRGKVVAEDGPVLMRVPELRERRRAALGPDKTHPLNVVISSRLDLPFEGKAFFTHPETRRLILTTPQAPEEARRQAARFGEVCVVPADSEGRVDLRAALGALHARGIKHLILEGGGTLASAFFQAQLVDDVFISLFPFLIGGTGVPSMLDGRGFEQNGLPALELRRCTQGKAGEIFLEYRVRPRPASAVTSAMFQNAVELWPIVEEPHEVKNGGGGRS
jgi:riboflavin-specific deaminase-like protein